jgi:hypothetical protein
VNRRGELDYAADHAALRHDRYRLLKVMIGRSHNETGRILRERASGLPALAVKAKMAERTARAAYAWLVHEGWYYPDAESSRRRVFGQLEIPDAAIVRQGRVKVCEYDGCHKGRGGPRLLTPGARSDARFCGDTCRKAYARTLAKSPDIEVAISPDIAPSDLAKSPDMSAVYCGQPWPIARTKPSSGPVSTGEGLLENSTEENVSNLSQQQGGVWTVECPFCGRRGGGDLGVVKHESDCWRAATWQLYEAER